MLLDIIENLNQSVQFVQIKQIVKHVVQLQMLVQNVNLVIIQMDLDVQLVHQKDVQNVVQQMVIVQNVVLVIIYHQKHVQLVIH